MTLGDFVKHLATLLKREQLKLPFKDERPWHYLFFELKRDRTLADRPQFLDEMIFDWDGPYPKCQELSEFLHALHWNASVSASNPTYETIQVSDEIAALWDPGQLTQEEQRFLTKAVGVAQKEFASA